ncbi:MULTISPECIES: LLM class flavin-dependent oxidoreductase [unclassified Haladaptatus]|uniref:LLM class flavin-dependent oxidoreductase n=1 Tax=unclassified Haladaptatus TaxID=2622732 RepID=UPI0023E80551|nr:MULTISPECIES: LLM class flavin-dependent oxidoreductase [unclassified Haladaptatus]
MRLGLLLPHIGTVDTTDLAMRAEDLGYGSVWLGELWGSDSTIHLTDIAAHTEEVEIGTAILNVFSRSPAVLAMTAATLDRVSDGRFTLGVGTSTPKAVEDLHGMAFDQPVRRSHETIELVKQFLGGGDERVNYDGEIFQTKDFPPLDADVEVYHAALGPANRRVVARLADGWIPHNIPFPQLEEAFEYVAEHAEEAGRDPDDITVAPYIPSAVSEDEEEAHDAVRGHIAYYVGSGKGYQRAVAQVFPEEAEEVAEAWRSGDRKAAARAVTDDMVMALGVSGTPDQARDRLRDVMANPVIDRPLITIPNQTAEQLSEQTITELSPDRL